MISGNPLHTKEVQFRKNYKHLKGDRATPNGGLNRPALRGSYLAARKTFRNMIQDRGILPLEDWTGNLSTCHQRNLH